EQCGVEFCNESYLKVHLRNHHGVKPALRALSHKHSETYLELFKLNEYKEEQKIKRGGKASDAHMEGTESYSLSHLHAETPSGSCTLNEKRRMFVCGSTLAEWNQKERSFGDKDSLSRVRRIEKAIV
ncbi:hypothetical protein PFISCL1PPCAC_21428, partial [Pristionchus fissidentatus]